MERVRNVSKYGMKVRLVYSELNYKLFKSGQERETVGLGSWDSSFHFNLVPLMFSFQ